jgi:hypothetical protein
MEKVTTRIEAVMKLKHFHRYGSLLFILLLLNAVPAFADCISPAGKGGRIEYTSASGERVFKYCNGTDWVPWASEPLTSIPPPAVGGGGGGATALSGLSDVDTSGVADGQCLIYNSSASKWEDGACAAGGGENLGNRAASRRGRP